MRKSLVLSVLAAGISSLGFSALSPTIARSLVVRDTPTATIDFITTGWTADVIRVKLNAAPVLFSTPGCDATLKDGYVVGAQQPAYKTHLANLLMAKQTGKNVSLVVSDRCLFGRPQIIGTYVY